jgi:hypothetical protein
MTAIDSGGRRRHVVVERRVLQSHEPERGRRIYSAVVQHTTDVLEKPEIEGTEWKWRLDTSPRRAAGLLPPAAMVDDARALSSIGVFDRFIGRYQYDN